MIKNFNQNFANLIRNRSLVSLFILLFIHLAGLVTYSFINHLVFHYLPTFEYLLPGDDLIAFIPAFIYPYYYWYLYMSIGIFIAIIDLVYFYPPAILSSILPNFSPYQQENHKLQKLANNDLKFKDYNEAPLFLKFFLATIILISCNLFFFILLPSYCSRPTNVTNDGSFAFYLMELIWHIDKPVNSMPSMHVSLTICYSLVYLAHYKNNPLVMKSWVKIFCYLSNIIIILSTLFTYQHHLIDVLIGILLPLLAIIISRNYINGLVKYINKEVGGINE